MTPARELPPRAGGREHEPGKATVPLFTGAEQGDRATVRDKPFLPLPLVE